MLYLNRAHNLNSSIRSCSDIYRKKIFKKAKLIKCFSFFPQPIAQKNIPKNKNGKKLRKYSFRGGYVCVTNPLPFLSFYHIALACWKSSNRRKYSVVHLKENFLKFSFSIFLCFS